MSYSDYSEYFEFSRYSEYFEFSTIKSKIMEYKEYIPLKFLIFSLPLFISFIIHRICNYLYCDEWYSILGLNMMCNACIDIKKLLKDHQISIYIGLGTYLATKINNIVETTTSNLTKYDKG